MPLAFLFNAAPDIDPADPALPLHPQPHLVRRVLRIVLLLLPAVLTLTLTLWGRAVLQESTVRELRADMDQSASLAANVAQLRMAQVQQLVRDNALLQKVWKLDRAQWEQLLDEQGFSQVLPGDYAFELIAIQQSDNDRFDVENRQTLVRAGAAELVVPATDLSYLQQLQVALNVARLTKTLASTGAFRCCSASLNRNLVQFVHPVPATGSSRFPQQGKRNYYVVLTLDIDQLGWSLIGRDSSRFEVMLFDHEYTLGDNNPVYHSNAYRDRTVYAPVSRAESLRVIAIGEQVWSVLLRPTSQSAPAGKLYPEDVALLAGLSLVAMMLFLAWLVARTGRHAQGLAEQRTRAFFASEARFERAVTGTQEGIWDVDVKAGRNYFSPRVYSLLGYENTAVERPLDWLLERIPAESHRLWSEHQKEWSTHAQQFHLELQLKKQTGALHWFRIRGQSIADNAGQVTYISGAISDIQAEKDAAIREKRLVNLTEASPDMVMAFDRHGNMLYMNKAGLHFFGIGRISGLHVEQLFGRSDTDLWLHQVEPQSVINAVWGGETQISRPDGKTVAVSQVVIGHRDEQGRIEYYSAVLRDITQIKRSEGALREMSERFERALNASNDGVFEQRIGQDKLIVSPRFKQVLGYGPEMPETWKFIYANTHPEDLDRLQALNRNLEEKGGKWSIDVRVRNQEGDYRWLRSRGEVLLNASGQPYLYTGVWSDITMQKLLESELLEHRDHLARLVDERTAKLALARDEAERANHVKSEFLANMSHELRTPMHAILSFARFGVEKWDKAEPGKLRQWFENIYKSGSRLLDLVNNLLDLSKLEAGKMHMDLRWQDTREVIDELLLEIDALVKDRELKIELRHQVDDLHAWIDGARFMQVLRNLLSNAIKFSPAGSVIVIAVRHDKTGVGGTDAPVDALVIDVIDQGVGIPEHELESVFDKFVQSSKTKSGAGGTGLGLAICREIIAAHHGAIVARNNAGACGATFEIRLPLTLPHPPASHSHHS